MCALRRIAAADHRLQMQRISKHEDGAAAAKTTTSEVSVKFKFSTADGFGTAE
jgi:hypothetical protein